MLNRFKFLLKAGVGIAGCVAAIGAAQATALTAVEGSAKDTSWQNIAGASYTITTDANHDGYVNAGDSIAVTIDMHKDHWGMHSFDALKVWIGGVAQTAQWNFSTADSRANKGNLYQGVGLAYNLPDQFFTFNYTATKDGLLDIYASVMCNDDLSKLVNDGPTGSHANPSAADWKAWTYEIARSQGEDKHYQILPVPEPQTYAMLLVGLGLLGFTARRRKDFTA